MEILHHRLRLAKKPPRSGCTEGSDKAVVHEGFLYTLVVGTMKQKMLLAMKLPTMYT